MERLRLTSEAVLILRKANGSSKGSAYATATIRKEMSCSFSKDVTTPTFERIQPNKISKRPARARRSLSRVQSTTSEVSSTDASSSRSMAPQPES